MPPPRPLRPGEARGTLANRLGERLAPRLWQLNTKFGLRPYRTFLVWTRWSGSERGAGDERILRRQEILPTPKVSDASRYSASNVGRLPDGTITLTEVNLNLTSDQLNGLWIPEKHEDVLPEPNDFYYEVVEDDRGDPKAQRAKYHLTSSYRDVEKVSWRLQLERMSEDNLRDGRSPYAARRGNGCDD